MFGSDLPLVTAAGVAALAIMATLAGLRRSLSWLTEGSRR
jgi:hypothetical protein